MSNKRRRARTDSDRRQRKGRCDKFAPVPRDRGYGGAPTMSAHQKWCVAMRLAYRCRGIRRAVRTFTSKYQTASNAGMTSQALVLANRRRCGLLRRKRKRFTAGLGIRRISFKRAEPTADELDVESDGIFWATMPLEVVVQPADRRLSYFRDWALRSLTNNAAFVPLPGTMIWNPIPVGYAIDPPTWGTLNRFTGGLSGSMGFGYTQPAFHYTGGRLDAPVLTPRMAGVSRARPFISVDRARNVGKRCGTCGRLNPREYGVFRVATRVGDFGWEKVRYQYSPDALPPLPKGVTHSPLWEWCAFGGVHYVEDPEV
jgi:hypothetical protein